jgi:hypothetical protein
MSMDQRDRKLGIQSPESYGEARRDLTPAFMARELERQMALLEKLNGHTIKPFLLGDCTIKELSEFVQANTAALGLVLKQSFCDAMCLPPTTKFPRDAMLDVSVEKDAHKVLTEQFESGVANVYTSTSSSGRSAKLVQTQKITGYGAQFDVIIKFRIRSSAAVAGAEVSADEEIVKVFHQHVLISPRPTQTSPLDIVMPKHREFAIGSVVDVFHSDPSIDTAALNQLADFASVSSGHFPRRNPVVKKIEHALNELAELADHLTQYLALCFPAAVSRHSTIAIPWAMCRRKKQDVKDDKDDKDEKDVKDVKMQDAEPQPDADAESCLGRETADALMKYLADQVAEMIPGQGPIGSLLQYVRLIKYCSVQFGRCYAGVDDVMVRSFLEAIGNHSKLFAKALPLHSLLWKIGVHQMIQDEIPLKSTRLHTDGCSFEFQIAFEGKSFEPCLGIPHINKEFKGQLCIGGIGDTPIDTVGTYTRTVFLAPHESQQGLSIENATKMRLVGTTDFHNPPAAVVIGVPNGSKTDVSAVFLMVDGWCLRMAINISAIPSNKEFQELTTVLPPEMKDFANAIRALTIGRSGVDVQIVNLRGPLAHAIGLPEGQLKGDHEYEAQLLTLMRGGASLACLSTAPKPGEGDWDCIPERSPAEVDGVKRKTDQLQNHLYAEGQKQKAPKHLDIAYRSCVGDGDGAPPPRRWAPPAAQPARAAQPRPAPAQPVQEECPEAGGGESASSGDAVDNLAKKVKDVNTDANYMNKIMDTCATMSDPKAVFGASLSFDVKKIEFAQYQFPDGETQTDVAEPDGWQCKPDFLSKQQMLVNLFRSYNKPLEVVRFVLYGVLPSFSTNALTALLDGSRDPTKIMLEAGQRVRDLQLATM